jgi:hypothetical protein
MLVCGTVTTQSTDIVTTDDDAGSLATLIIRLNIARRNFGAYPKGHPIITTSLAKVLNVYEGLLHKHDGLILGVTSDSLMVDGVILKKSNVVYRDFSRALFERGIGALLFHSGLTIEELSNFTIILGLKQEQIQQLGGIEQVWAKARIVAMTIRPIRYDLFQATDEDSITIDRAILSGEGLWDKFEKELTLSELSYGRSDDACLDPEILAEVLNRRFAVGNINEAEIRKAIADFLAPSDIDFSSETLSGRPYQKLAAFISNLTPELRRQFLESSFAAKSKDRQTSAERILNNLSDSAILETLEDISNNRLSVSPVVFGLLQHLGQKITQQRSITQNNDNDNDLSCKLKTIFQEHAAEEYIPAAYQKELDSIKASERFSPLSIEDSTDLLKTVETRSIENSIGQILMNFIREGVETPEERDLLLQNLSDMFGFFLQTGDYGQLHAMIDQLADGTFPEEIQQRLREKYGQREFQEEILDGLTTWGKPRYADIRSLIHKIGGGFVEAILERLSEEKNMSLRRFYMDCLTEMGPVTRLPIINRLNDHRWYFLRNLLIILTAQNDPTVVPLIKPLLRRDDPRLRNEVLKALVHFRDPQAEKQILNDLDSPNPEQQTTAIQLAEQCSSPDIVSKLINMLSPGGFSTVECERKSTIIRALGETGRSEAMPELAKILRSRSLFYARQLTKLKAEVIRSLSKYPPTVARPVLERIANGSGELSSLATETLRIIPGKQL